MSANFTITIPTLKWICRGRTSPSINDRFSELILLINIDKESFRNRVRFVNFLPKDTDIAEFSGAY